MRRRVHVALSVSPRRRRWQLWLPVGAFFLAALVVLQLGSYHEGTSPLPCCVARWGAVNACMGSQGYASGCTERNCCQLHTSQQPAHCSRSTRQKHSRASF
jgi:hypothetical protein